MRTAERSPGSVRRLIAVLALLFCIRPTTVTAQFTWAGAAARVSGWQQDLDSVVAVFLPRDRSFDAEARERFVRDTHRLRDSVATLTDEQLTVRLWWFGNDLVIVRAHAEYAALLGGRILSLARRSVADLGASVAPLYAANPSWARYLSTYLLTSPEILKGIGLLAGDSLEVTVERRDHRVVTTRMAPLPLARSDQPLEAWWDLSPTGASVQGPWVAALPDDTSRLPLYLRHLDRYYWSERIRGSRTVYLQYNRAQDQPGRESVRAFGDRVIEDLERDPPRKLVVDLRFNTGGDLGLADPFFRRIAALPWVQERGRLFVSTGRATFSAGITPVALLRQLTRASIVGEPVGDALAFWAEGGNILLRNTRLTLHYAEGFHSYSPREYPAFRPYHYDLAVTEIGPDVPVESSLAEYLAGRDAAMEAIARFRP